MIKSTFVVSLLLPVLVLTGCLKSEDLLNGYKDLSPPDLINENSISKTAEILNVVEHFNLKGEKQDPFCRDHFALEAGGLKLEGLDDIVSALGIPNEAKQEEWVGGQLLTRLEYDYAYFSIDNASQKIFECGIWAEIEPGPRGVRIGDSVSSVISKFYYEAEISINEPNNICSLAMEDEYCAYLYQLQPDSRVAFIIFDSKTGTVNRLLYGMHYGQHCGVSWLWFDIIDSRVSAIWFYVG